LAPSLCSGLSLGWNRDSPKQYEKPSLTSGGTKILMRRQKVKKKAEHLLEKGEYVQKDNQAGSVGELHL